MVHDGYAMGGLGFLPRRRRVCLDGCEVSRR